MNDEMNDHPSQSLLWALRCSFSAPMMSGVFMLLLIPPPSLIRVLNASFTSSFVIPWKIHCSSACPHEHS